MAKKKQTPRKRARKAPRKRRSPRRKTRRKPRRRAAPKRRRRAAPKRRRRSPAKRRRRARSNMTPLDIGVLNPDMNVAMKHYGARGLGVFLGLILGPLAAGASKQTGFAGDAVASLTPVAVGEAMRRWLGWRVVGSSMIGVGFGLAMLAALRHFKPKIPYIKDMDLGPLGQRPCLYHNKATGQYFAPTTSGPRPVRLPTAGKRVEISVDGQRVRGDLMGGLETEYGPAMVIRDPLRGHLVPIAVTKDTRAQLTRQGVRLNGVEPDSSYSGPSLDGVTSGGRYRAPALAGTKPAGLSGVEPDSAYTGPNRGFAGIGDAHTSRGPMRLIRRQNVRGRY